MQTALASGAASFIVMLAMVALGRVTNLGDLPFFDYSSGFIAGAAFAATYSFMERVA